MKHLLTYSLPLVTIAGTAFGEIDFQQAHGLFQKYCHECHNPADEKGNLDLAVLETEADYLSKPILLEDLEWVIAEKEMPTPEAPAHPTGPERESMVEWLHQELMKIQNAQPNDPGDVVMPRISSKEFDYVIEDLTGHDYNLAQYLTSDTAAGEGFYNVGAGQQLSIGQFESFMSVGKMLMNYSRFVPGMGIWWMDQPSDPLESDEDLGNFMKEQWASWHENVHHQAREKHQNEVKRLMAGNGLGPYAEAAWQYLHRRSLGAGNATFAHVAKAYDPPLYASGVEKAFNLLTGNLPEDQFKARELMENLILKEFARRWNALPRPQGNDRYSAREDIKELMEWLDMVRSTNDWYRDSMEVAFQVEPVDNPESQQRRGFYHDGKGYLKLDLTKVPGDYLYLAGSGELYPSQTKPIVIWRNGRVQMKDGSTKSWNEVFTELETHEGKSVDFGYHPSRELPDDQVAVQTPGYLKLRIPENAEILEIDGTYDEEQTGKRVLRVKPYANEPPDYYADFSRRKVIGSDHPIQEIKNAVGELNEANQLDASHNNLYDRRTVDNFYDAPQEILDFVGIDERPKLTDNFNHWRSIWAWTPEEIRESATHAQRKQGERIWKAMAAAAANSDLNEQQLNAQARLALEDFTKRAWRTVPSTAQIDGLMALYRQEKENGQTTEASLETAMRAVMIAPKFLYRFTESRGSEDPYPLQGREIATRLAFVLWSGLPDERLYQLADAGQLQNRQVLLNEVDRMLGHERAERFIEEFAGRWLGFAEFDSFSGPDQEKFDKFTPEVREAMYQEAKLFIEHILLEQKPITDIFYADYTFLNEPLARHYGIRGVKGNEMRLVELDTNRRGGILGMGAFLTKTSTPLRTSPVHRGLWLYEGVLDLPVPEPPPVPQLSDEGVDEAGNTITEQLRQHREDPACYSCHDRFDPLGVALENFDPIGRWREKVEGKAPVSSTGQFRSGETIDGIAGLREYLKSREEQLLEAFATKLLGYSLGRSVLPTDKPVIEQMITAMRSNNLSIRSALHVALTSPQFLNRRDTATAEVAGNF
ncbi:MAG: DUF1592 domain-containing protein [Opitutales bacterium]